MAQSYLKEALAECAFHQSRLLQSSHKALMQLMQWEDRAFSCMLVDVGRPAGADKTNARGGIRWKEGRKVWNRPAKGWNRRCYGAGDE